MTTPQPAGRKIALPDYCSIFTGYSRGGRDDCDHDYDPKYEMDRDQCCLTWTCTRCGMRRTYEVYD